MKFLQSCRLLISTLSPVHVGCGEDYEPTNYVIDNGTLYEFEPGAAMKAFTAKDREQLLKIVRDPGNKRMLQEVQAFFYGHRKTLMKTAKRQVPVVPKLAEFYESRVGKAVQIEGDGSQLVNKLAVLRTFFNPINGAPILPGSSLKGAIRTALLDEINRARPLQGQEKNLTLQQRLFQYQSFENDPMRLVQLTDAALQEGVAVSSELRFAVNRRRKAPKSNDDSQQSLAQKGGLYQLLECVSASRFRAFAGQLTVQEINAVSDRRNEFPAAELRWSIEQIAQACNRFYRPQLESELAAMQECGYLDQSWAAMIKHLLNSDVGQKLDQNQIFLLRTGRHSGAESVTLNGVRSIKIMRGKDQSPEYRSQTTTWWLAANDTDAKSGMLPFGWLLVELQPIFEPSSDWPEVRAMLNRLKTEVSQQIDGKRQQIEITRQLQAQEQVRQQAVAAKAMLSVEQKAIVELREWLMVDRKTKQLKPKGRVDGTLNRLLREATSWPLKERQDLAALAEEIIGQKSLSGNGKAQAERQARIQQLRHGEP